MQIAELNGFVRTVEVRNVRVFEGAESVGRGSATKGRLVVTDYDGTGLREVVERGLGRLCGEWLCGSGRCLRGWEGLWDC